VVAAWAGAMRNPRNICCKFARAILRMAEHHERSASIKLMAGKDR
jgi:hypothetical protein